MKLLDIVTSPWAIVPSKLEEITAIYATHLRGEKIDLAAVEARLGRPLVNERTPYQVDQGVATVSMNGPLAKRANLFMQVSGGTSMQILASDLRAALADPGVNAVVLVIDSPGGTVDGTVELAQAVMDARGGDKPVVAWVDGMMASAAYWIGAGADAVFLGAGTDAIGSIGVAMQHIDTSARDSREGIKRTDIYAGKYKRIASDAQPLSREGRATLQAQVDTYYTLFVEAVAAARGADVDTVLERMADGRIFIGAQAIDAGLADGIMALDTLKAALADGSYARMRGLRGAAAGSGPQAPGAVTPGSGTSSSPVRRTARPDIRSDAAAQAAAPQSAAAQTAAQSAAPNSAVPEAAAGAAAAPLPETRMDLATLKSTHPELVATLVADAAAAERARIQGVLATALPGHEALVQDLAFDGRTTAGEAALAVNAAERAALAKAGVTLRDARPAAVPAEKPAADKDVDAAQASAAADAKTPEEKARAEWAADANLRASFADDLDTYLAYAKAEAAGRVRILGKKTV